VNCFRTDMHFVVRCTYWLSLIRAVNSEVHRVRSSTFVRQLGDLSLDHIELHIYNS